MTALTRGWQEELGLKFPEGALVIMRQACLSRQFDRVAGVIDNMFYKYVRGVV